ncbi:Tyrosine-protein kinase BTK [Lamellibrachia satsuma]|nr:Tyrosine-protein kinase BTK [Lamellibrachia satsuma]
MATDEKHIIKDFMVKRSQMKGQLKAVNYKSRWFVLTASALRYHEGALETGVKREKGRINLGDVISVEKVDNDSLERSGDAFQVVYNDTHSHQVCTLYIITTRSNHCDEWIKLIREASKSCGAKFSEMYHPGVYNIKQRRFTCCYSIDRYNRGCEETTFCPQRPAESEKSGAVCTGGEVHPGTMKQLPPLPPEQSQTQTKKNKVMIAMYDYDTNEPGDMCLKKGERYEIIDESEPHWLLAISQFGEKGYVPANYLDEESETGLETYDWYFHGITRIQYEKILRNDSREGCFLVRDSSQQGMYAVSLLTFTKTPEGSIHHYHIKMNDKKEYYLNESHAFKTLPQLVNFHQRYNAGLCVRLQATPSNTTVSQPATAGFGHGINEIDHRDLELLEKLGSGQFGTVKKAVYKPRNQEVAVKMLNPGAMSEDELIKEATTMKNLQHPNLVQLYGICSCRPIYVVTEFMKNGALHHYLRDNDKKLMHGPVRLDMCVQVCFGMLYLESKQYVHRDLAARNCLVGERNQVKVGDFGLARFAEEGFYNCQKGNFSVRWAAPEVVTFLHFSNKSDVWAFGVLMWEVYSLGKMPYGTSTNADVVEHVKRTQPPLERPDRCSADIYKVMTNCWKRNADDRPPFKDIHETLKKLHRRSYDM